MNIRPSRPRALPLCLLIVFSLVLSACAGSARAISSSGLGRAGDPIPMMPQVRMGRLPSGMRYYLLENSYPEGRAFLTLAVHAGSILEEEDEQGLAHFVEHMAFNGTARFPQTELINYLRSLGMRFGPDINAYTSFEETVYGIEVPVQTEAGGRRVIPGMALAVIDDWSHSITFNPDEVENERLVIMEEYRFRTGAGQRVSRELLQAIMRGSPYAQRLPIGLLEVIETAPAQRLEDFYRRWYRPENMALIIVGDFDAAYLESTLDEHFSLPEAREDSSPFRRPRHDLPPPRRGSLETLVITDSELARSRVDLYWKLSPRAPQNDIASYRESIIEYLLFTMLSLRFQEEEAKLETPYVWAGGGSSSYGYSGRFFILAAQAKTAQTKETLEALFLTQEALSRYGFIQEEVNEAKASLLAFMEQQASERDNQSSNFFVRSFTRHFLRGDVIADVDWELDAVQRLLPGITINEINQAARRLFASDDLTVIISAPEAEAPSLPEDSEIRAIRAAARRATISPPATRALQGDLLPELPAPGRILAETLDQDTGALRMILSNGAEVILQETQNRTAELSFYAQARGGTFSAPPSTAVSADLAAEMLNASGLGSFNRSELTRLLLDKQVSLSFWTQSHLRGFQGTSSVRDLSVLFEMLYLNFTQIRLDSQAIEVLLDQRRSSMAFQENDPTFVFNREITRTIYGNRRYHPLTIEDLDQADMDQALDFLMGLFNPADYVFVFTGNIDLAQIRPLIETYLASIPPGPEFNQWDPTDPQRPRGTTFREIHRGQDERSAVYMGWFLPYPYSETMAAAVSVLDEYLNIRLTDQIRENLGGVYTISSWASISPIPRDELSGGVYFICDPQRALELSDAVYQEFVRIREGDIDPETLEKAREALIQGHEQAIQRNLHLAQSYANSAQIFRSPLSRLNERPGLHRQVGPSQLQEAAALLLGGSQAHFVLYPQ
ncbi:MAG: insulinase family protein [Treponema sp.]|nr:insulinase family protein [Treponema sp.]